MLTFFARRRPEEAGCRPASRVPQSRSRRRTGRGVRLGVALAALVASLGGRVPAAAAAPPVPQGDQGQDSRAMLYAAHFRPGADGTARIVVTLSKPVTVTPKVAGKTAEYVLADTYVPARNSKNALVTRYFATVVTSARIVPEGQGATRKKKHRKKKHEAEGPAAVRVIVDMREEASPTYRVVRNADGTAALQIDFPRPTTPPPPEPDPVPPGGSRSPAPAPEPDAPPAEG